MTDAQFLAAITIIWLTVEIVASAVRIIWRRPTRGD